MCSTLGKLCLILYISYGLFYCSYFSDAEDCIILAGIPLLFKEKPENVLIWGQDQKDYPMSIKIKQCCPWIRYIPGFCRRNTYLLM